MRSATFHFFGGFVCAVVACLAGCRSKPLMVISNNFGVPVTLVSDEDARTASRGQVQTIPFPTGTEELIVVRGSQALRYPLLYPQPADRYWDFRGLGKQMFFYSLTPTGELVVLLPGDRAQAEPQPAGFPLAPKQE